MLESEDGFRLFLRGGVCGNVGTSEASLALCLNLDLIGTLFFSLQH